MTEGQKINQSKISKKLTMTSRKTSFQNEADELKSWFEDVVKLPQYYDVFKREHIENLSMVEKLKEDDLIDMGRNGVIVAGDRQVIWECIEKRQKNRRKSLCRCLSVCGSPSDAASESCICVIL